jgi:hypothetical protein
MPEVAPLERCPAFIAAVQKAETLIADPIEWPPACPTPDLIPEFHQPNTSELVGAPLAEPEQWELAPLSGPERILYALALTGRVTIAELTSVWGITDILAELDALKSKGDCPLRFVPRLDADGTISGTSEIVPHNDNYWWFDDLWQKGGYKDSFSHQMKQEWGV